MLKAKKKFSKKELKEDKFVAFTLQARDYIETNSKKLIIYSLIVVLVIFSVWFYSYLKNQANVDASALLGEAQLAYTSGDAAKGEEQLKKLVEEYPGVKSTGNGCFILAKKYWEKNDYVNAETYFKKYLDDYADDDLLTSAAYAGYADCLANKGDMKSAAENYKKAGSVNRELPLTPSYIYSAAMAYMEADQIQEAKKLTQDILDNFSNSEYKKKAELLMGMLQVKA